ncbi:GNAT family N-acetyltransferase [Acutalibacter sp.]|uniref:GNAT family N-acetyltransferase n=1 Tax=Acutalibacter sp. TaxID=1918636 RepID=UPI0034E02BD2
MIQPMETESRKKWACRSVLEALPDWFANPASVEEYVEACGQLPLWAELQEGEAQGFIAFRPTSPYAGEIYVMGVRQERHRQGLGRALFQALYAYARERGLRFLTVKTVEMGRYADYDSTNLFYRSLGFVELECFPTLWDEANPCQVYVMEVKG